MCTSFCEFVGPSISSNRNAIYNFTVSSNQN